MAATKSCAMARMVKSGLAGGGPVEIERLGIFERDGTGQCRFTARRKPVVFLAYVVEDSARALRLYERLEAAGFDPWMDKKKLVAGQNWPRAIEGAIETADYFVAVLSRRSTVKRGTFQAELRYALDCAKDALLDEIFFIPVRLDNCLVPRRIRKQLQYLDLFPDEEEGLKRLEEVIRNDWRERCAG